MEGHIVLIVEQGVEGIEDKMENIAIDGDEQIVGDH